jgi:hypothetical protein
MRKKKGKNKNRFYEMMVFDLLSVLKGPPEEDICGVGAQR